MVWFSLLTAAVLAIVGWIVFSQVRDTVRDNIEKELSVSTDFLRTAIKTAVDVSIRNHLRAVAESNKHILTDLQRRVASGELTLAEGKQRAADILLSQRIGKTGYLYVLDEQGVTEVHPNPVMKNRDMSFHWLAVQQTKQREGYLEYDWQNPGENQERSKALYMTYFQPWGWIITATSYRDEFTALLDVDDFRKTVESFRFGSSGYAYVFSGAGEIVIHPWLTGNVKNQPNELVRTIFTKMTERDHGKLTYSWQDPGDKRIREKLAFFTHIPEFDWIIASSVYLDETYLPLQYIARVIAQILVVTIPVVICLCLFLSALITRPISQLTRRMSEATTGDYSVRAAEEALGEVGILAHHFNGYMKRLTTSARKLELEISERTRTEQQLKLFGRVFENALEGITITDAKANIVAVNKAFTNITGFATEEVLGRNPRILKSDRHDHLFYEEMWNALLRDGSWTGEIWNRRRSGEAYPEILSISAIFNSEGEVTHYVAVFHDITEMKMKEEQIQHQAYHDALTELPNRLLARDRLAMAMAVAKRQRSRVAVFFLDLDNFKHINDSLGHAAGDRVLQDVAKRLVGLVREEDTVARLGGDEFEIVGVDIAKDQQISDLAHRILSIFSRPFSIEGHELFITGSIGVSVFPQDGKDVETLTRNADVAMYQAKNMGKNSFCRFTRDLSDKALSRLTLESEMRQALQKREFTVFYQPKVDPVEERVVGVEALVRWRKPSGEIVSPADFIPIAEETGLITEMGEQILADACEAIHTLDSIGFPGIKMAVNLSPYQFTQADLVDQILDSLRDRQMAETRLELEITETTMMTNLEDSVAKLNFLVEAGVSISIDDFGTGYSSLYYLKALPIDTLKIDRSFISHITIDPNDAKIVETIILMAKNLGIGVVAEGVETKEQLELLKSFGCELIQGYYYSRPLSLEELVAYLKRGVGYSKSG